MTSRILFSFSVVVLVLRAVVVPRRLLLALQVHHTQS
jgi:hypothetical protein